MSNYRSLPQAEAKRWLGVPVNFEEQSNHRKVGAMKRLTAWFAGEIALTRSEAHRLLESAVESGQISDYHAEFVAAIKALAAGPRSWHDMGYRLLSDD
jgi:hypothetical protein